MPAAAGEGSDSAGGSGGAVEWSGHFKLQGLAASFPDDSIFRDLLGADAQDAILDLRLNFSASAGGWDFAADGQLIAILGDTLEAPLPFRDLALLTGASALIGDDLRLFDLTSVHHDEGRSAFLTRLDRLSIGYTGKRGAVRFGRQAITWGNGFVFTPMDIFNPFDPTAVDKEYKTGDDMLYGQLLTSRDDDLQGVVVFRRDAETGDVESEAGSAALKYHGVVGRGELDVMAARHFGDSLFGVGGNRSLGGTVWRGDAVVTATDDST
ncbi:MAG: hypothetical protein R3190_17025, partial [Thermoanaerobaculia bacterium]|nr:hypothetical protein [Thermoanaerobaculia bacterium]